MFQVKHRLSPAERLTLVQTLNALPVPQFDELIFALNPPPGNIPGSAAPQGSRSAALLQWVASPIGPGLADLEAVLASFMSSTTTATLQSAPQQKTVEALIEIIQTLALKPMTEVNQNFHGPVGNVAGTNYGTMTAYINQNSGDINNLLTALRETAQAFPQEQQDEAVMELDDLEIDLKAKPPNPKRIGKRLQRLVAAGTAAATLAGGVATFSGNLNDFTGNVLELADKVGLSRDAVQP